MRITKNQFEILSYVERTGTSKMTQRKIANDLSFSLGVVNRTLSELSKEGFIQVNENREVSITDAGLDALEPYRVKRMIIIAAGFGARLVPITLNTPKPLVRIHGKRMIETLLDAACEAEIEEIFIVRGYLWEQFDVLLRKYPNIRFLQNEIYNESNNISSVWVARGFLESAYICEADLLLQNKGLIRKYEYETNYLGAYQKYTDDWCFTVKCERIVDIEIGGEQCFHMFGISFWKREDGQKLSTCIDKIFNSPGGKEKFWDIVAIRDFKKDFNIQIRPCNMEDIIEIDTFNELKRIDPVYRG